MADEIEKTLQVSDTEARAALTYAFAVMLSKPFSPAQYIVAEGQTPEALRCFEELRVALLRIVPSSMLRIRMRQIHIMRSMRTKISFSMLLRHFALAVPLYTHFTSPIRRYADLVVHRLLAESLGYAPSGYTNVSTYLVNAILSLALLMSYYYYEYYYYVLLYV